MAEFNFKPFDKVLVRGGNVKIWSAGLFSHYNKGGITGATGMAATITHHYWDEIIPYEGNEHLLGTTDDYVVPYIPKVGDFVAIEETHTNGDKAKWICIFDVLGKDEIHFLVGLSSDSSLLRDGNRGYYTRDHKESFRLATEEEKQQLLDALHKGGKDWDESKKGIVEYKWKPKDGEEYHYCKYNDELNDFEVETTKWHALYTDTNRREANNCFKEFIECSNACDRMNESFKALLKGGKE